MTQLQDLLLWWDQLTTLPDWIGNLTGLYYLDVDGNELRSLPESIGNLTLLSNLYLYSNHLTTLPHSIGNLIGLASSDMPPYIIDEPNFDLHDNDLVILPSEFFSLDRIHRLSVSSNCLYLSGLTEENVSFLDGYDRGWQSTQTVCNDSRIIDTHSRTITQHKGLLL